MAILKEKAMVIDWSNAPKEATHYDLREFVSPAFMRKNHNDCDWEFFGDKHWIMYGQLAPDQAAQLIEKPWPWAADKLPQVGTICEVESPHSEGEWSECEILTWDAECTVFRACGDYPYMYDGQGIGCFRPIRTPEQIAAEARDNAIADLYFAINWNEGRETWPMISSGRKADYAKAADAGYRKFEIHDES